MDQEQVAIRQVDIHTVDSKLASNLVITSQYTALNFIFKNLFRQFSRVSNAYFFCICVLQSIEEISITKGAPTTAFPLVFILFVGMLKDAFEDWQRHKADRIENSRTILECKTNLEESSRVMWKDLRVGQVVKIANREMVPADVVILASSNDDGLCHTMTANLDGETNLKLRQVADGDLLKASGLEGTPEVRAARAKGSVQCDLPNKHLHHFEGTFVDAKGDKTALGPNNIMLRGTQLRNTEWILGVIIYTGSETKLQMNNVDPPYKTSTLSTHINKVTLRALGAQCMFSLTAALIGGVWLGEEQVQNANYLWGPNDAPDPAWAAFLQFWTFILIFANYIPISLLVTTDMVKFFSAMIIAWDIDLYHSDSDTPMSVRCSDLNEELGQVEHIFSDKTGTLTCNLMEFARCTIEGVSYGEDLNTVDKNLLAKEPNTSNVGIYSPALRQILSDEKHPSYQGVFDFFLHLACNHEVMPEHPDGPESLVYSAASPDEEALVNAAAHYGIKFMDRTQKQIFLTVNGKDVTYDILHTLEFNSDRKRSSVLLRRVGADASTEEVLMFTKGADNIIKQRLSTSSNDLKGLATCDQHIIDYSKTGLRTLMIGRRRLAPSVYQPWAERYHEAETAMEGRAERMDKLMDEIEGELFLLGATAIEDKLQDGVPDTIRCLREAGIKVWVLTGDKVDTAISIAGTAQLFLPDMELIQICAEDNEMELDRHGVPVQAAISSKLEEKLRNAAAVKGKDMGLVVDSAALMAIQNFNLGEKFLDLCAFCKSVVCARVTPDQKGQVVTLVRNTERKPVTLAIGDGANDVNMIQKAQIGVGISGQEGLQAVNASDYAIAQFRFLKKLLLVHGRWSLRRMGVLACFMFYKNGVCVLPQFFFGFFSLFSGQPIYFDGFYQTYNIFYTGLPILLFGIFDQDVSSKVTLANPALYREGPQKLYFNDKMFWTWMAEAFVEGLFILMFAFFAYGYGNTYSNGMSTTLYDNGSMVFLSVIHFSTLRLFLETRTWNWMYCAVLALSYSSWYMFHWFLSQTSPGWGVGISVFKSAEMIGTMQIYNGYFFMNIILVVGVALMAMLTPLGYKLMVMPLLSTILGEWEKGYGKGSEARVYADDSEDTQQKTLPPITPLGGSIEPEKREGKQSKPKLEPLTSVDPTQLSAIQR